MLILAIETSTSVCSIALYDGEKIVAEQSIDNGLTHSEKLMPEIKNMLQKVNISINDITALAVGTGPGSFTGLRIGLSSAKAISYALNIPVVGIPTSILLCWNVPVEGIVLSVLIDAQKDNVFQSIYEWENSVLKEREAICMRSFDDALNHPFLIDKKTVFLGDVPNTLCHIKKPRAAALALAAADKIRKIGYDNIFTLEPYYVKKSEAEILWEKRQNT